MSNNQAKKAQRSVSQPETKASEEEKVVPIAKKIVLTERDLDRRDKHILDFHLFVPEGTCIEDISSPDCWAHIAYKMAPMSQITVQEKSGKWVALLYVVTCNKLSAETEIIWYKEIKANAAVDPNSDFEVQWINHQEKFGVLRKSDKVWIARNLPTSTEAAVVMGNEMLANRGG